MLFEEPVSGFTHKTGKLYYPKLDKVGVTVEGIFNQLNAHWETVFQQWNEEYKLLGASPASKYSKDSSTVHKVY